MSATLLDVTIDDISEANAPVIYVKDGLKPFLAAVKEEVSSQVPDLSTAKGRDRIASLAAKVSKSKVAVEKPGREYLKRLKEMPKVVELELREFVDAMDALRDETRKPLTDWEAAETARKDAHVDAIQTIVDLALDIGLLSSTELRSGIAAAEAIQLGEHWEEFEAEAARTKDYALTKLRAALSAREQYEAEQAELVRLRAEVEAQAQRDWEAEIARAAAETARIEAEQRAQAERVVAARREQELIDQAAAAQRATEQAARNAEAAAERQRLQLKLQAEQAERQAAQAKADQLAAEQRAEQARVTAEQRQAQAVEQARQNELARQAAAVAFELEQSQAREADIQHKKAINRAALDAFVAGGMTEECAKQAITLIAQRKIPAIAITY
jgi:hypothetical protein